MRLFRVLIVLSAALAALPARAVDLVRYQAEPRDPRYGALFHAADEAC